MTFATPKVVLILLSVAGFWTLWGFPYQNGLLKLLNQQTQPGAVIPGPTIAPMKQTYIGIGAVDKQLTVLVSFFYTAIDGNRADVSLSFLYLGGQVLASWVLIMVESLRHGNSGKLLLTATTLLGVGVAIVGYACVAPLWFALHLWTSSTVTNPRVNHIYVDVPIKIALVPISILTGFGLPSIFMCLPAPNLVSFETKQTWAGIQQAWSLWIGLTQLILTTLALSVDQQAPVLSESQKKIKSRKYLRFAYAFAIICSAGSHLTALSLTGLAYLFPVLFSPNYRSQLQPGRVFLPVVPFGQPQVQVLADGALWFLQWDIIVGVSAALMWAVTLRVGAKHFNNTVAQSLFGLVQIVLSTALLGPCGTAALSLRSRDELVFGRADAEAKRGKSS